MDTLLSDCPVCEALKIPPGLPLSPKTRFLKWVLHRAAGVKCPRRYPRRHGGWFSGLDS